MGLLDSLKSMLGGSNTGTDLGQFQAIWEWIQEQGGIEALLNKFRQGELGDVLSSWVGTGKNAAISSTDIQSAFGSTALQSLAGKLGTDPQKASDLLAQFLPKLVDGISPEGEVKPDMAANTPDIAGFISNIFKR